MAYRRSALMEERLASNRQRILEATRVLIARGGLRDAQVSAVAAEAGMSTGVIYRYFKAKTDLFVEVLAEAVTLEIEILDAICAGPGTVTERLYAAVESFVRRALNGPNLAYAFIAEPADPEVDVARIRERKRFAEVFRQLLAEGTASGEFAAQNLEASAACIVGAYTEALVGPIGPAREVVADREALIRSICAFCVRAVGGHTGQS